MSVPNNREDITELVRRLNDAQKYSIELNNMIYTLKEDLCKALFPYTNHGLNPQFVFGDFIVHVNSLTNLNISPINENFK